MLCVTGHRTGHIVTVVLVAIVTLIRRRRLMFTGRRAEVLSMKDLNAFALR